MHHLRSLSVVITAAGLIILLVTLLADLGPTWGLVGLLLAWAGLVKLLVVRLWRNLDSKRQSPDVSSQ